MNKGAPLNEKIADKIENASVVCLLKDYDRSYESRFERSFPVIKLHVQVQERAGASRTLPVVLDDTRVQPHGNAEQGEKFPHVLDNTHVHGCENAEQKETFSPTLDDTHASKLHVSRSKAVEKEKQMFSPKTKGILDGMATEVVLDVAVSLADTATKRGILFGDSSDEEHILNGEKTAVSTDEISSTAAASESPIKKLKNVRGHI